MDTENRRKREEKQAENRNPSGEISLQKTWQDVIHCELDLQKHATNAQRVLKRPAAACGEAEKSLTFLTEVIYSSTREKVLIIINRFPIHQENNEWKMIQVLIVLIGNKWLRWSQTSLE